MTEFPLKFIDGNCAFSTACALSDSEFGTLRLLPDTLNETEEKKLETKGADTRRTNTQVMTIARWCFLITALSGSKKEWFVFIYDRILFVHNLAGSAERIFHTSALGNCGR